MSQEFNTIEGNMVVISEAKQLAKRLSSLGINSNETELVVQEAALMFGEGRPEHEVEQIVADYLEMEGHKILSTEAEADRQTEQSE